MQPKPEQGTSPDEPRTTARGAHTFNLSGELSNFTDFAMARVIPAYASRYHEQIAREWEKVSKRFSDKTPATQKLYVSKFRKALELAVLQLEPKADRRDGIISRLRKIVKSDPSLIELVNETYSAKVVENTCKLVLIDNYRDIVALARNWLSADDDILCAIALMLLTGRRFYEVLVAGEFSPTFAHIDERGIRGTIMSKWTLRFLGQLKTREAEGTRFEQSYAIPTLAPASEILAALHRIRASSIGKIAANSTQEATNSLLNPKFNRSLRKSDLAAIWPSHDPDFSLKSTRALYAEICFKHHAPSGIHKDTYFSQILGHREGDLRTALSYVRYYLEEKDGDLARAELLRIASESERQNRELTEQKDETQVRLTKYDRVKASRIRTQGSRDALRPGDIAPEAIRDRLKQKGIELGAFAKLVGKHRTTVWRNMVGSGNTDIHQAIAEALELPLVSLWPSRYG